LRNNVLDEQKYTSGSTFLIGWPVLTTLLNLHTVITFTKQSSSCEADGRSMSHKIPKTALPCPHARPSRRNFQSARLSTSSHLFLRDSWNEQINDREWRHSDTVKQQFSPGTRSVHLSSCFRGTAFLHHLPGMKMRVYHFPFLLVQVHMLFHQLMLSILLMPSYSRSSLNSYNAIFHTVNTKLL
jgi:hypothetical protein